MLPSTLTVSTWITGESSANVSWSWKKKPAPLWHESVKLPAQFNITPPSQQKTQQNKAESIAYLKKTHTHTKRNTWTHDDELHSVNNSDVHHSEYLFLFFSLLLLAFHLIFALTLNWLTVSKNSLQVPLCNCFKLCPRCDLDMTTSCLFHSSSSMEIKILEQSRFHHVWCVFCCFFFFNSRAKYSYTNES